MKKRYGLEWPDEVPDYQIDLILARFQKVPAYWKFLQIDPAGLDFLPPEEHMCRAIRELFPPEIFKLNPWSEKLIWAWCNYNEIVVMGPASANKSHTFGLLALLDWYIAPRTTSTFFASTTKSALERRSWSSILSFFQTLKRRGGPGDLSKSRTAILNEDDLKQEGLGYDVKSGLFGIAVLAGTLQDALSNIVGVHQPTYDGGVRLIADEAQAVKQAFIDARYNLRMGTPDFRIVLLGNPMSFEDPLGTMACPAGGWSRVSIDDDKWETRTGGVCIHLDGERSPAVLEDDGPTKYPFLINRIQMDDVLKANHGNANARDYLTMCRGWILEDGNVDVVLPRTLLDKHCMRDPVIWESEFVPVAGIDPAFSSGGDQAPMQIAYVGYSNSGVLTVAFGPTEYLAIDSKSQTPVLYQLSEQIVAKIKEYQIDPRHVAFDETGTQRVSDVVEMEGGLRGCLRKSFSSRASDLPVSMLNPTPAREYYRDVVTELWYQMQEFGQFGQVRALPPQAVREFGMRILLPRRPRQLESKADMKKRLGHSPDTADACALCLAVARERLGFIPGAAKFDMNPGAVRVGTAREYEEASRFHDVDSLESNYQELGI